MRRRNNILKFERVSGDSFVGIVMDSKEIIVSLEIILTSADCNLQTYKKALLHFSSHPSRQNIQTIYHTGVLKSEVENSRRGRRSSADATVRYRRNAIISVIVVTETRGVSGKLRKRERRKSTARSTGDPDH